jgi:hypothetical protein
MGNKSYMTVKQGYNQRRLLPTFLKVTVPAKGGTVSFYDGILAQKRRIK